MFYSQSTHPIPFSTFKNIKVKFAKVQKCKSLYFPRKFVFLSLYCFSHGVNLHFGRFLWAGNSLILTR